MAFFSRSTITLVLSLLYFSKNAHSSPGGDIEVYHDRIKSQVILVENGKSICGGTIVSDRTVLTAAQCVVDAKTGRLKSIPLYAYAFVNDRVKGGHQEKRMIRHVKSIAVHSEYRHPRTGSDIAVLTLTEGFSEKSGVKVLGVPSQRNNYVNSWATVTGFTENVSTYPTQANMEGVQILSDRACYQFWGNQYGNNRICDTFVPSYKDCYDITGRGLVTDKAVIGVASYQKPCVPGKGRPNAVYTKVSAFVDWIQAAAS